MRMRKKRHGSERVQALSSLYYDGQGEIWTDLDAIYEKKQPLAIEIGCGKGDFIAKLSVRDADFNYIAVEKVADVSVCAAEKYARSRGLGDMAPNGGWKAPDGTVYKNGDSWDIPLSVRGNVRFVIGDAMRVLESLPSDSVSVVYANFSDPWPKKGYAKRRLTHAAFLEQYRELLKPGGMLFLKTDNEGLFRFSLEQFALCGCTVEWMTEDLHASELAKDNVMTEYERNFSERGQVIYSAHVRI